MESTRRPEVVGGLGGFGAAVGIPAGYRDPLLVASTDGVGTKTAIAASLGRFDTIGIDLVAMCADDVVCCGAEPLAFLDYVAVGQVVPEWVAELVGSVAAGCREAGCALVGGETAEHPGLMDPDGVRPRRAAASASSSAPTSSTARRRAPGDAIIGLAASGLHSNGFSLVRALLAQWDLDLAEPYQARLRRSLGDAEAEAAIAAAPHEAMATLGEILLTPTRMYARAVLAARAARPGDAGWTSTASPTSPAADCPATCRGPFPRASRRGSIRGAGACRRSCACSGRSAGWTTTELRATFNGGLGMVVVLPPGRRRRGARVAGRGRASTPASSGR